MSMVPRIKQTIVVDEIILACAVRYALGRKSYIVSVIYDEVMNNLKIISDNMLRSIIKDIENCDNLGSNIDTKYWNKLVENLKGEQKRRDGK